jgi:uncharacterized radical SAM superfamily Fe-S cluster-containing enzyme
LRGGSEGEAKLSVKTSDAVAANAFNVIQPETTYSGSRIEAPKRGLPKITHSLCPECTRVIEALIFEENGRVMMEKTCPHHGYFKDVVFSDVKLYLKMDEWSFGDNRGVMNPNVPDAARCPDQCGLCSQHTSHTGLANLDLTNRCNLTCPVCFANANAAGYLYEPTLDQVRRMLQALRNERPVAARVVQFSGGEPTIYPRFFDALRLAREMGYSHIQAATNGIMFTDLEFTMKAKEAGLHTLYLQFDGTSDEVYRRMRGEPLLEKKLKCIENVRKAGMKICFVPTIVKGINDQEIGAIIRTAIEHIDVVSAIAFQPVCFTGRISRQELEAKRFTQADVARCVQDQTGLCDMYEDWFPLSCVTPFSKLMSALRGQQTTMLSSHPHCSIGTYLFVDRVSRKAVPITRFMDIASMLREMDVMARKASSARLKFWTKIDAWQSLKRHFRPEYAPPGLTFTKFLQTLQGMTDKRWGREGKDGEFTYHTLMVAGMHFMDHYNYDVERVKRCIVHYAAPNGQIYPFCTYNSGPTFRNKIEKKFSMPFEQQLPMQALCGNGNGNGSGHGSGLVQLKQV